MCRRPRKELVCFNRARQPCRSTARPRTSLNDPPAFVLHMVKYASTIVKKGAVGWKLAMKKVRFDFVENVSSC